MRRILGIVLWLTCFFAAPVQAGEVAFGRYHALVIGINDYAHLPKLKTAVKDAEAVAEVLKARHGFSVRLLRNATRDDILLALNEYRAELTESDNLLVYYAGHGVLDRRTDTGFWQPADAMADNDLNWIPNEDLTRRLSAMSARHVMIIADSCYSGALVRSADSRLPTGSDRRRLFARLAEKRSRTAIVSGGLEPVADSGRNGHSVFANAFLAALRDNAEIIEGLSLFTRISRPVIVNARQTPQYADIRNAGHEGGEFIFVPKGATVVVVPPATVAPVDERRFDLAFWESVKDSNEQAAFEAYLAKYPDGIYATLARLNLKKFADPGARTPKPAPRPAAPGHATLIPAKPKGGAAAVPAVGVHGPDLVPGHVFKDCDICPEMVVLPAGSFTMGTPDTEAGRKAIEGPRHEVTFARPFAIAKFEVTFEEWDACVSEGGCKRGGRSDKGWGRGRLPVIHVTWHQAKAYTAWLAARTGKPYRLPSEAEWEYAARAGAPTRYPWGDDATHGEICRHANGRDRSTGSHLANRACDDGSAERTAEVGRYEGNDFGLFDMIGNVEEWLEDCLNKSYVAAPDDGTAWTGGNCDYHMKRGGSWNARPRELRVGRRSFADAVFAMPHIGFRVAMGR